MSQCSTAGSHPNPLLLPTTGGTVKPISGNAGGLFCALNPTTITMLSLNPSARLMAEIRSQTVRPFVPALIKR